MKDNNLKNTATGQTSKVLIPVDFSSNDPLSVKVGFELAKRLEQEAVLLHASVIASPMIEPQFPDDFNGIDNESAELEEIELDNEIHEIDSKNFTALSRDINILQKKGELPELKYSTALTPGMPEETIAAFCEENPVSVIVMTTRGRERRNEELVGSVTAEVIDHSFAPVMSVPESYTFEGFQNIINICAFCFCDEGDFQALTKLMNMFHNPKVKIYLFPANDKIKGNELNERLSSFSKRLSETYSNSSFVAPTLAEKFNFREETEKYFKENSIQMTLVPNRKRNAIARFFHPGLAHKILYEIDFPMLAIPV